MDWNLLFTIFFTLGLLVIYMPQYWKMFNMKSSYGFHQLFMFLGHMASYLSCLNSFIYYINNWWNCHGSLECTESFFGFGLIVFQWLLFWVFYAMFLLYHPQDRSDIVVSSGCGGIFQTRRMAVAFFIMSHFMMVFSLGMTLGLLGKARWHENEQDAGLMVWSGILELTILVMFLAHYIPQIYETYRLKKVGSLSLVTLGMMCPGTFLWTAYLAFQPSLTNNGESNAHQVETGLMKSQVMVWLPYLIVGFMQFFLLIIGIYYERYQKKLNRYYLDLKFDNEKDSLLLNGNLDENLGEETSEW